MAQGKRPGVTDASRFEQKVDRSGNCHRWTGAHSRDGYGHFYLDGRVRGAHVVALLLAGIAVPNGMTVDHVLARGCVHRDCVRVDHLEVVTHRENVLRSSSPFAVKAKATHCPRGHEYAGENLYIQRCNGQRTCRACWNARARERYAAKRARLTA